MVESPWETEEMEEILEPGSAESARRRRVVEWRRIAVWVEEGEVGVALGGDKMDAAEARTNRKSAALK